MLETRGFNALVRLVASWHDWSEARSWYLAEFVPRIVANGPAAGRDDDERQQISTLRDLLDSQEWAALDKLLVKVENHAASLRPTITAKRNRQRAERELTERRRRASERRERQAARYQELRQQREERQRAERKGELARRQAERERERARQPLLRRLDAKFESDFLGARGWLRTNDPEALVDEARFADAAADYVTRWCKANLKSYEPDREQAAAIASVTGHTLVGARAGSGKTATMVARAAFLVRACGVEPAQILMLAFNRSAAEEMRERVETLLPGQHPPHVMTFHALAHRVVHPTENLLYDMSDSMKPLSRFVQDITNEFIRDPKRQQRIREVMLAYFRRDWSRIVGRGDNLSPAEQVEYRRHLQHESIKGDFVNSYGEKVIANTLLENGLDYGYEHDVRWNGTNYKPDFSVYDQNKTRRVVIEYFGMTNEPEYDEQADQKRAYWAEQPDVAFLEYYPRDVRASEFQSRLLADLAEAGAPLRRLTDEEIWARVKIPALDRFTETVTQLIGRARQRRWTGDELVAEWNKYGFGDDDLDRFISLSSEILNMYAARLSASGREDFTGLMWRAVDEVRSGTTTFGRGGRTDGDLCALRYIVVDEFQDFSLMFYELVQRVLEETPNARVMAVGDDWQAINEFAGSTVEYFERFEHGFPDADRLTMSTNRRSTESLVDLGNSIMKGRGTPARTKQQRSTGVIREFHLEDFEPRPRESNAFGAHDLLTPPLLRLIQDHRNNGRSVAVLARTVNGTHTVTINEAKHTFPNFDKYGAWVRQTLQVEDPDEVQFSSVHGFKGQEADAVILLDVTARNFPFIHPTWILFQVFGDTIQTITDAERRLFYVAVSRPRTHLDIVTTNRNPSPFWTTARRPSSDPWNPHSWKTLPEVRLAGDDTHVEIRVYNSYEIKDQLKKENYRYQGGARYWWKLVETSAFDSAALLAAIWAKHPGLRIEAWRDGQRVLDHQVPAHR